MTVLLIAALGFTNYILLKLYGARGVEFTGFLGGLVNSTVTVTELAHRVQASSGRLSEATYRGVALATMAMLLRNAVILGLLAPAALLDSTVPLALMIAGTALATVVGDRPERSSSDDMWTEEKQAGTPGSEPPLAAIQSPFSLTEAFKFGIVFLALQIAGALAQRALGHTGFYGVSVVGGVVSSASAVASAGNLAAAGTLPPEVAGIGATLASLMSVIVNLPLVARLAKHRTLTRRVAWMLSGVVLLGAIGTVIQTFWPLTLA